MSPPKETRGEKRYHDGWDAERLCCERFQTTSGVILAPTKAILVTFDFQRCQRAPYLASRSRLARHLYKKPYKIRMGRTPFQIYAQISQNSYRVRTRKQGIRQSCSNEKAVTRPAEGGTGIIAHQRKVLDLTFSGNVNCLFFKKIFLLKKSTTKVRVFGAVPGVKKIKQF